MSPAYLAIVDAHYNKLYCFALSLSRNESDAADLTQQAYLKLARNWDSIRDREKSKSWLFSTLYREFIDRQRRKKICSEVDLNAIAIEPPEESSPSRFTSIDQEAALRALYTLEPNLRAPLVLYYLEDYTYREIAEVLAIPLGTVMSRLHRGKQTLRKKLFKKKDSPSDFDLRSTPVQGHGG